MTRNEYQRILMRAKYRRLRAEGLCTRCGKAKPAEGRKACKQCLAVNLARKMPIKGQGELVGNAKWQRLEFERDPYQ